MQKWKLANQELSASPIPQVGVTPTPAPGLKGPKGLSPKQNYSQMNSGLPPILEAGAMSQKSAPPLGANMLPVKVAGEGSMGTMSSTPTLQDMIKSAMAGATTRAQLAEEAAHQQALMEEKVAGEKCGRLGCFFKRPISGCK